MTEQEMVERVHRRLKEKRTQAHTEVSFLSRSIDMLLCKDDEITAIEFKLRDWRKGIQQAKECLIGADFAYVCLPKRKKPVDGCLKKSFLQAGIGLFTFDPDGDFPLTEVIRAKRSDLLWEPWKKRLLTKIASLNEESDNGHR